jgi:hypothetical protein
LGDTAGTAVNGISSSPQNNIRGKTLKDVAFSQHFLKYWVPFFDCDQLKK